MSNKSPFELRFDVLSMAKEYSDKMYDTNVDFARRIFDESVAMGTATADDWVKFIPKKYTMDDVISKARELYEFVQKKD